MKLSKKTFIYSTIISIIIVSLIVGYFIFMLPSLYIDFISNRNLKSVTSLSKGVMEFGSYKNLEVGNPTGTITIKIPETGDSFYILNKFFESTIVVRDQDFKKVLQKIRYYTSHKDQIEDINFKDWHLEKLAEKLTPDETMMKDYPLKFSFNELKYKNTYQEKSSKLHLVNDQLVVYESNVTDGQNYYTTYSAMGISNGVIYITMVPLMTPSMDEITPVIFQSLPMIIAVALLLVLISSQVFSGLIINPIIRLAKHAEYMKDSESLKLEPIKLSGHDEINILAESLNKLYIKVQENMRELEIKNQFLAEENHRQEVFLRASSHQLKTPVTAALLLVEGMINEVGKYKEVKVYLPQVKTQLQSMQKIVEDILYLNHCSEHLQLEYYLPEELVQDCISSYSVQLEKKELKVNYSGHMFEVLTDRELISKIIDNLLSNAISYTPDGGTIDIKYEGNSLCVNNYGISIEEELLPHVFEAFVTSNNNTKGHGLGLYIVSYYAKLLGCQVSIQNINGGVSAKLTFKIENPL